MRPSGIETFATWLIPWWCIIYCTEGIHLRNNYGYLWADVGLSCDQACSGVDLECDFKDFPPKSDDDAKKLMTDAYDGTIKLSRAVGTNEQHNDIIPFMTSSVTGIGWKAGHVTPDCNAEPTGPGRRTIRRFCRCRGSSGASSFKHLFGSPGDSCTKSCAKYDLICDFDNFRKTPYQRIQFIMRLTYGSSIRWSDGPGAGIQNEPFMPAIHEINEVFGWAMESVEEPDCSGRPTGVGADATRRFCQCYDDTTKCPPTSRRWKEINGYWYMQLSSKMNHRSGEDACQELSDDAHIATFRNAQDYSFLSDIRDVLHLNKSEEVWLSGRRGIKGEFVDYSGTVPFVKWAPGQPYDHDCLSAGKPAFKINKDNASESQNYMNAHWCEAHLSVICQIRCFHDESEVGSSGIKARRFVLLAILICAIAAGVIAIILCRRHQGKSPFMTFTDIKEEFQKVTTRDRPFRHESDIPLVTFATVNGTTPRDELDQRQDSVGDHQQHSALVPPIPAPRTAGDQYDNYYESIDSRDRDFDDFDPDSPAYQQLNSSSPHTPSDKDQKTRSHIVTFSLDGQ